MTTAQEIKELEAFLKTAFCVDGVCKNKGFFKLIAKNGGHEDALTFELNDSKRGRFLVSISIVD